MIKHDRLVHITIKNLATQMRTAIISNSAFLKADSKACDCQTINCTKLYVMTAASSNIIIKR